MAPETVSLNHPKLCIGCIPNTKSHIYVMFWLVSDLDQNQVQVSEPMPITHITTPLVLPSSMRLTESGTSRILQTRKPHFYDNSNSVDMMDILALHTTHCW